MKKRLLSLLLCVVLLVWLIPTGAVTAFAAENDLASTGDYDYTDPSNPYIATSFSGLQTVFNQECTVSKTVYIKLGKNISCTSTEDSDGRLITKGADVVLDLCGYTLSCTDKNYCEFILGRKGKVVINDSQRYDSSKQEWITGKIEYFFEPIQGEYIVIPFHTTILSGDVVVNSGEFVNKTRASYDSNVYRGNALKLYGGAFDSDHPVCLTEVKEACGIYGGSLLMQGNSKAAITIDLTSVADASTAKLPTVTNCDILNDTGKTFATAVAINFSEEFADGLTYDNAKAVYDRIFPSGAVLYQDGYKMASVTGGFRYTIGSDVGYSPLFESEYHIVTPEPINSIALTIPTPMANDTITYQAQAPDDAHYAINTTYGDSSYWSHGVCWTRVGYIGPMNCHVAFDFLQDKSYKVEIAVKSNDDQQYPFADQPTTTVNGKTATVTDQGDGTYVVSCTFDIPLVISSVAVTVTAPQAGALPSHTATVPSGKGYMVEDYDGDVYQDGVAWYHIDGSEMTYGEKFKAGHRYEVYVSLVTAAPGEQFATSDLTGTVNGETATAAAYSESTAKKNIYVKYIFSIPKKTVSSVAITITPPVLGAQRSYTAAVTGEGVKLEDSNTNVFSHGVSWQVGSTGLPADDNQPFEADTAYTVGFSIVLTDTTQYQLAPRTSFNATVNGKTARVTKYSDTNYLIRYTFPALSGGAILGDVDGDGEVTILDATAIQRWLAGLSSNDMIGKPM